MISSYSKESTGNDRSILLSQKQAEATQLISYVIATPQTADSEVQSACAEENTPGMRLLCGLAAVIITKTPPVGKQHPICKFGENTSG